SGSPKTLTCAGNGSGPGNPTTPDNKPPVAPGLSSLSATVNQTFSATLPAFSDPENGALTYALTGLPSGLSFSADNRTISGTPTQQGTFTLSYSATDNKGAKTSA
ncbi:putative Ig domain-containing protein, partial [Larkinella soli]|uniref:putative Ig domain-containing protein n=1 Tax=Larkinella soli TaxID=1770527 RepID=UPI0019D15E9D